MPSDIAPAVIPALVASVAAAFATGFLGSLHCIGMCGTTVASALSRDTAGGAALLQGARAGRSLSILRVAAPSTSSSGTMAGISDIACIPTISTGSSSLAISSALRASLLFNAGRVTSYVIAGAIVAGLAGAVAGRVVINDITPLRLMLFVFGQLLVIATGLYVAGATTILAPFEKAGQWFWQRLQRWIGPRLRGHLLNGQARPFAFGVLWGWIPCGLVYGALATASAAGSTQNGALVMLGFGLGTMPAMFAAGAASLPLRRAAQLPQIRIAAGAIIVALGIVGLSRLPYLADFAALARLCASTLSPT